MSMDILEGLQRMLNEDGTEFPAPWRQVPEEWRDQFKSWVASVKQQSFDHYDMAFFGDGLKADKKRKVLKGDNWSRGWDMYHLEFMRFLVDEELSRR